MLWFFPEKTAVYFNRALEVFRKARELKLSASITPHAPYSVPPDLFTKIFSFGENDPPLFSYHNQESAEESILFEKKDGDFLTLFNHFKIPVPDFFATHKNSITSVLPYFPINNRTLFVHNTYASRSDLDLIHSSLADAWFCFCPNANRYIENRLPDFSLFKNLDDCICIGTDSYASNYSLSILEELKTIQQHDPSISTDQLLRWSTLNGARFFKWEEELGSINPVRGQVLILYPVWMKH
jgi:cytosine/adenosine deaminase-related metal-dependent hydrolase